MRLDNHPLRAPPLQQRHGLEIPLPLRIVHCGVARLIPDAELRARVEQHFHHGHAVRDFILPQAGVGDVVGDDGRDEGCGSSGILCVDVGAEGEEEADKLGLAKLGGAV